MTAGLPVKTPNIIFNKCLLLNQGILTVTMPAKTLNYYLLPQSKSVLPTSPLQMCPLEVSLSRGAVLQPTRYSGPRKKKECLKLCTFLLLKLAHMDNQKANVNKYINVQYS